MLITSLTSAGIVSSLLLARAFPSLACSSPFLPARASCVVRYSQELEKLRDPANASAAPVKEKSRKRAEAAEGDDELALVKRMSMSEVRVCVCVCVRVREPANESAAPVKEKPASELRRQKETTSLLLSSA
jgi:hypothetical protein